MRTRGVVVAAIILSLAGGLVLVVHRAQAPGAVPTDLQIELRWMKYFIETAVSVAEHPEQCDTSTLFDQGLAEIPSPAVMDTGDVYVNPDPLAFLRDDNTMVVVYRPDESSSGVACLASGRVERVERLPEWTLD